MKLLKVHLGVVSTVLVAVLAFIAGFLSNEASRINEAREEKEARRQLVSTPSTDVALLRLEPRPYESRLSYTGWVRAWRSATLAFAEVGIVEEFVVDRGDRVEGPRGDAPGTVLATLDKVKVEAIVRAVEAELEKAQWERERIESLFGRGMASEEDLKAASLVCAVKETELARARKVLQDTTLRAPFTGMIAERFVEPGETASPQSPAYRLVQIDKVRVVVSIPGRRINEVEVGQRAEVAVETRVGESVVLPGEVHTVPPAAVEQLFEVEIAVDNSDGLLKEGMVAKTTIYTHTSQRVFVLPLETVLQVGNLRKVVVVEKNGSVTDGFFDLALLPPRVGERLAAQGLELEPGQWHDLPRSEWDGLGLTSVERLKAKVHSSRQSVPRSDRLRGPGIRVLHVGDVARERILKTSRVEGDLCLVPDDGTLQEGEMLVVRGQHRVADGSEVVPSERNELPVPGTGEYP